MTSKNLPFNTGKVINIEHMSAETKERIQRKLFELGYKWPTGGQTVQYLTDTSHCWYRIYTDGDFVRRRDQIMPEGYEEITLRELMETEVPPPVDPNEPIPGYPGWVVGAKLRQIGDTRFFGTTQGHVYTITHVDPENRGVRVDGQVTSSPDIKGFKTHFELVTEDPWEGWVAGAKVKCVKKRPFFTVGSLYEIVGVHENSDGTYVAVLDDDKDRTTIQQTKYKFELVTEPEPKTTGMFPENRYIDVQYMSAESKQSVLDHLAALGYQKRELGETGINYIEFYSIGSVWRLRNDGALRSDSVAITLRELMERQPDPVTELTGRVYLPTAGISKSQARQIVDMLLGAGISHPNFNRQDLYDHFCWGGSGNWLRIDLNSQELWWVHNKPVRTISRGELLTYLTTKTEEATPEPKEVIGPGFVDLRRESSETIRQLRSHLQSLGYSVVQGADRNWLEVLPHTPKAYFLNLKESLFSGSEDTEYTVQDILAMKAPLTEEEKIQQALPEGLKGLKVGDLIRFTEGFRDTPEGYITEITGMTLVDGGREVRVHYVDSVSDEYDTLASRGVFEKLGKPNRRFSVSWEGSEALRSALLDHIKSLGYEVIVVDNDKYVHGRSSGNAGTFPAAGSEEHLTIAQVFQLTKEDVYV